MLGACLVARCSSTDTQQVSHDSQSRSQQWGAYDAEPMSDKQTRYSRVNIMESSPPARLCTGAMRWPTFSIVAHIRTRSPGGSDWADEYYTVYPDGVAGRKQVLHHSDRVQPPDMWHEWQETIIVNGPGTRPEDNVQNDALTLANMSGLLRNCR